MHVVDVSQGQTTTSLSWPPTNITLTWVVFMSAQLKEASV